MYDKPKYEARLHKLLDKFGVKKRSQSHLMMCAEQEEIVSTLVDSLPEIKHMVVRGIYYSEKTTITLAKELGFSGPPGVSNQHKSALKILREKMLEIYDDDKDAPLSSSAETY